MKKIKVGKLNVEVFDSIEELPVSRFHKYNKFLLLDSSVGSDINDLLVHVDKAMRLMVSNPGLAKIELANLRQNIYLITEEMSVKHMTFATLVHSIDGVECSDISDEGLRETHAKLNQTKKGVLDWLIGLAKKKIDSELTAYFPSMFTDVMVKEFYDKLKARTLLILDDIIDGVQSKSKVDNIDNYLLTLAKPVAFGSDTSIEVGYDKQFEDMTLVLSKHLNLDAKKLTVLEYYNAFEFLKKQNKNGK